MKPSLRAGLTHRFVYTVPENKTVPHLYPEADMFQTMPAVFAKGFMVGLMEWTCIQLMEPHLDDGRRFSFLIRAFDGIDLIGEGRHERVMVNWDRFNARLAEKPAKAMAG